MSDADGERDVLPVAETATDGRRSRGATTVTVALELDNAAHGDWSDVEEALATLCRALAVAAPLVASPIDVVVLSNDDAAGQRAVGLLDGFLADVPVGLRHLVLPGTTYFEKKTLAALRCGSDLVLFADCDCTYAPGWAASLITMLARGDTEVVSGRTFARLDGASIRQRASALVWQFAVDDPADPRGARKATYGNNFGAVVEAMRRVPIPRFESFRSQSVVWRRELQARGVTTSFDESARAWHRQPDGVVELTVRGWHQGADRDVDLRVQRPLGLPGRVAHALGGSVREVPAFVRLVSRIPTSAAITPGVKARACGYAVPYHGARTLGQFAAALKPGRPEIRWDYEDLGPSA